MQTALITLRTDQGDWERDVELPLGVPARRVCDHLVTWLRSSIGLWPTPQAVELVVERDGQVHPVRSNQTLAEVGVQDGLFLWCRPVREGVATWEPTPEPARQTIAAPLTQRTFRPFASGRKATVRPYPGGGAPTEAARPGLSIPGRGRLGPLPGEHYGPAPSQFAPPTAPLLVEPTRPPRPPTADPLPPPPAEPRRVSVSRYPGASAPAPSPAPAPAPAVPPPPPSPPEPPPSHPPVADHPSKLPKMKRYHDPH